MCVDFTIYIYFFFLVVSPREKKKRNNMGGLLLHFPVYAWTWISISIFSESRGGIAVSWSKFWSVFATLHWLLLISPMNSCTSRRKEEFCEGISQRPPTHWKQICSPYPLGISLKIILVIPCKELLSKAFLMAHVQARVFSGGGNSIRRAFYPASHLLKEIRISISLCFSNATLGHLKVSSIPSI